jgi:hypothetical protein
MRWVASSSRGTSTQGPGATVRYASDFSDAPAGRGVRARSAVEWVAREVALAGLAAVLRAVVVGTVGGIFVWGMFATSAWAGFGDEFGAAPVNRDGFTTVGALPDDDPGPDPSADVDDKAFWGGTCDRFAAPGFGVSIPGGFGSRPATVDIPADDNSYNFIEDVPAPVTPEHCIDWGKEAPYPCSNGAQPCVDPNLLWATPPGWRLAPVTQAGAHPDATAMFHMARNREENPRFRGYVDGAVDNIVARLPAGFLGDPRSVVKCTAEQFNVRPLACPPESQVGVLRVRIEAIPGIQANFGDSDIGVHPVYNLEPRPGKLAEFGVAYLSSERATTARIVAKARTNGDFGVDTLVMQLPAIVPLISQQITLWGVPYAASNDYWRAPTGTERIPFDGMAPGDRVSYDPSWGPIKPLISNPTECSGLPLRTQLLMSSFEDPAGFDLERYPALPAPVPGTAPGSSWAPPSAAGTQWEEAAAAADPVTGCEKPPFDPEISLEPDSTVADSASGLSVDLSVPQNDDPPAGVADDPDDSAGAPAHWRSDAGVATSQLEGTVVTLPEGISVNPSGATGLQGCSDAQMGLVANGTPPRFNDDDPFDNKGQECPDGSKIGEVQVDTPVLEEPLEGDVVLGTPRGTDPEVTDLAKQMFRLFIVARSEERGLVAKIAGFSNLDKDTGQITTTFRQNPRVPFEHLHLDLKKGSKGLLALPQRCKTSTWTTLFTPWTAAHGAGGQPVVDGDGIVTDQRCGFGFAPTLDAGMSSRQAAGSGTFTLRFGRQDGEQWVRGASVELPPGLLAAVKDVPLCGNAQANANACPLASKIGTVDGTAGTGDPFVLEKKGSVFLTEGYKGAPYGLAVSVPVEAGPFRGAFALKPIVVRQALRVDPTDASAAAVSDPLPLIHHGILLRAREVTVSIDRPGFMRNPTDCSAKTVRGVFASAAGATAAPAKQIRASGCAALGFKPRLSMRLTGKRQTKTGGHPGIRAQLTMPGGQANVKSTTVRLPKAFALDTRNAEVCDYEESLKADLKCPASTVIGRARAVSPLLKGPLAGNVYFAENKRINSFGRQVSTLPSLVVALRGEVAINIRANTDAVPGKALITTFPAVPDAPVSQFNLNIGADGPLQITRTLRGKSIDICKGRQTAEADFDAHNGKVRDLNVRMKTPCPKVKKKPVCKTKKQKRSKKCKARAKKRR